jgi:hypothetical protein
MGARMIDMRSTLQEDIIRIRARDRTRACMETTVDVRARAHIRLRRDMVTIRVAHLTYAQDLPRRACTRSVRAPPRLNLSHNRSRSRSMVATGAMLVTRRSTEDAAASRITDILPRQLARRTTPRTADHRRLGASTTFQIRMARVRERVRVRRERRGPAARLTWGRDSFRRWEVDRGRLGCMVPVWALVRVRVRVRLVEVLAMEG